jgi:hypothetical protein
LDCGVRFLDCGVRFLKHCIGLNDAEIVVSGSDCGVRF